MDAEHDHPASEQGPPDPEGAETPAHAKEILTVAAMAERWSVSTDFVMKQVRDPKAPLAAIPMGRPEGKSKRRLMLRFRIETVRAWERDQERTFAPPPRPEPAGRPAGYEGPLRLGARGRPAGYDGPIYTGHRKGRGKS